MLNFTFIVFAKMFYNVFSFTKTCQKKLFKMHVDFIIETRTECIKDQV